MKKTRTISINPSRLVVAKLPVSLLCPAVVALTSQPVLAAQSLPAPNQNLSIPSQNPAAPVQLPSMPGLSPSGVGPLAPTQAVPAPISTPQTLPLPSIFPPQSMTPFTVPPGFSLRQLPSEPPSASASAEALKTSPIKLGALIQVAALGPISLDAHFNQPITIEEALSYALEKSLPVRISRESSIYQTTQLAYYMSFFMPSFSTIYALAKSNVNSDTNTSAKIFQTRLSFPVFAGGSYTYFTLAQFYRVLGWNEAFHANVNDILLDVYNKYTNLVLNHHLLRIRIKAVEVSEAQLAQNTIMYQAGSGTKFAIMQARTQLATDRQALLSQQVATRQAALLLGYALDMPLSANLVPVDLDIAQHRLIHGKTTIQQLINTAVRLRPELREYEHFRLAAARDVQIGAAPLYPNASFFLAYTTSNLSFNGNPNDINGVAVTAISLGGLNAGAASNNALGQQASLSPGNNQTAASGANTGAATVVASSGGAPLNNTQSGGLVTSGAVPPSIIGPVGVTGTGGSSNLNGTNTASAGSAPGIFNSFQGGINLTWSLPNGGMNSVANVVALRALSRQALLQANQQLTIVIEQVRSAYLNSLSATNQIESTGSQLDSSKEALRLAELRYKSGQATNLEVLRAQSDYINSLVIEAQSIIAFQQAQAQLIHDLGVINVETLTRGYSLADVPVKR